MQKINNIQRKSLLFLARRLGNGQPRKVENLQTIINNCWPDTTENCDFSPEAEGTQTPPLPGSKEVLGCWRSLSSVAGSHLESLGFHITMPLPSPVRNALGASQSVTTIQKRPSGEQSRVPIVLCDIHGSLWGG